MHLPVRFHGALQCCGWQVAAVLSVVSSYAEEPVWYAADVPWIPALAGAGDGAPRRLGSLRDFVDDVGCVRQLEGGVFLAVPASIAPARLRDTPETFDDVTAELGDAVAEVRAFDCSCIEVLSTDAALFRELSSVLGALVKQR